jgi:hypothetical protein
MKTLLLIGWVGAVTLAAATYPVAHVIDGRAIEAYLIAAKDPKAVEVEKAIFEPPKGAAKESKEYRDAVMRIYGSQTDEPTKVVFVPKEKFIHPEELPSLTLLPVEKEKGENPLQVKTVYFFAQKAVMGFAAAGVVLLLLWILVGRKKANAAPPPPPAVSKT